MIGCVWVICCILDVSDYCIGFYEVAFLLWEIIFGSVWCFVSDTYAVVIAKWIIWITLYVVFPRIMKVIDLLLLNTMMIIVSMFF